MAGYGISFAVFLFYGFIIGVTMWLGYHFTQTIVNVSKNVGAVIGIVIGLLISFGFWVYGGKKLVEG